MASNEEILNITLRINNKDAVDKVIKDQTISVAFDTKKIFADFDRIISRINDIQKRASAVNLSGTADVIERKLQRQALQSTGGYSRFPSGNNLQSASSTELKAAYDFEKFKAQRAQQLVSYVKEGQQLLKSQQVSQSSLGKQIQQINADSNKQVQTYVNNLKAARQSAFQNLVSQTGIRGNGPLASLAGKEADINFQRQQGQLLLRSQQIPPAVLAKQVQQIQQENNRQIVAAISKTNANRQATFQSSILSSTSLASKTSPLNTLAGNEARIQSELIIQKNRQAANLVQVAKDKAAAEKESLAASKDFERFKATTIKNTLAAQRTAIKNTEATRGGAGFQEQSLDEIRKRIGAPPRGPIILPDRQQLARDEEARNQFRRNNFINPELVRNAGGGGANFFKNFFGGGGSGGGPEEPESGKRSGGNNNNGFLFGTDVVQDAFFVFQGVFSGVADLLHRAADAGVQFQQSIVSVAAVLESQTKIVDKQGTAVDIIQEVSAQQDRARAVQLGARNELIPLGIGGAQESALVRGFETGTAGRLDLSPEATSKILGRLGAFQQVAAPGLSNNPTLLLRELENALQGVSTRGQLATPLKRFAPGLLTATTEQEALKSTEGLDKFIDSLKNSTQAATQLQRALGGIDQLFTIAGDALLQSLKPGLKAIADVLNGDAVKEAVKNIGTIIGTLGSSLLQFAADVLPSVVDQVNKFISDLENAVEGGIIEQLGETLANFISNIPQAIINLLQTVGNIIGSFVTAIPSLIAQGIAGTISGGDNAGGQAVGDALSNILGPGSNAQSTADDAANAIKGFFSAADKAAKDIVDTLKNSAETASNLTKAIPRDSAFIEDVLKQAGLNLENLAKPLQPLNNPNFVGSQINKAATIAGGSEQERPNLRFLAQAQAAQFTKQLDFFKKSQPDTFEGQRAANAKALELIPQAIQSLNVSRTEFEGDKFERDNEGKLVNQSPEALEKINAQIGIIDSQIKEAQNQYTQAVRESTNIILNEKSARLEAAHNFTNLTQSLQTATDSLNEFGKRADAQFTGKEEEILNQAADVQSKGGVIPDNLAAIINDPGLRADYALKAASANLNANLASVGLSGTPTNSGATDLFSRTQGGTFQDSLNAEFTGLNQSTENLNLQFEKLAATINKLNGGNAPVPFNPGNTGLTAGLTAGFQGPKEGLSPSGPGNNNTPLPFDPEKAYNFLPPNPLTNSPAGLTPGFQPPPLFTPPALTRNGLPSPPLFTPPPLSPIEQAKSTVSNIGTSIGNFIFGNLDKILVPDDSDENAIPSSSGSLLGPAFNKDGSLNGKIKSSAPFSDIGNHDLTSVLGLVNPLTSVSTDAAGAPEGASGSISGTIIPGQTINAQSILPQNIGGFGLSSGYTANKYPDFNYEEPNPTEELKKSLGGALRNIVDRLSGKSGDKNLDTSSLLLPAGGAPAGASGSVSGGTFPDISPNAVVQLAAGGPIGAGATDALLGLQSPNITNTTQSKVIGNVGAFNNSTDFNTNGNTSAPAATPTSDSMQQFLNGLTSTLNTTLPQAFQSALNSSFGGN